jgi:hypothetical protein
VGHIFGEGNIADLEPDACDLPLARVAVRRMDVAPRMRKFVKLIRPLGRGGSLSSNARRTR